ncbi:23S rRNA (adenine(2030)-N(6))-methyltransferase RlmJ [Devosia sp. ZB163]|uniref:23S rRNA (adenine(2030)-N(6))-methyltransferase RlmJ n=1 Tax=Devosia sp. ZB163 TaxID=3025938 RepID=UPI00235FCDB4|nr:23S rRNA (adenine(2030)-N(6))-methyltransferase RlmJ [Devosia sp. ZB163]MDC9822361.1 23S rRNA (adenine(2030)-N(6))-methyltransferase RlmJ [Devosia sp. ZB163]
MNYSHAFHAGNFADVMKHIVLTRLVQYLQKKDAAFRVIDTHAGIGRYDLTGEIAKRSPEWVDGIGRLLKTPLPQKAQALAEPYLKVIAEMNPGGGVETYPGSPLLVRKLFRPQDRLSALELHPEYVKRLGALFEGDVQVRVIHLDGWLALNAHVPPKEKRGLVLVDPPFEEKGEFDRMIDGLVKGHRKFANGIYALWYPLKDTRAVHDFISGLHATGIPKMLRAEVSVRPASNPPRLHGSGMILVNPPFTLEGELRVLLPALAQLLGDPGQGRHKLEWIRGEA